jgi:hypothetical protein
MPDISLTDFVDFVTRSGNPRLTRVRQVRGRGQYHPAFDFWRGLRQAIVKFHKDGSRDFEILDRAVRNQTDPRKQVLFAQAAQAYRRFVEKKRIHWFEPPKEAWEAAGLVVRVNPELGLRFDGQSYVIKLHFREEELSKQKIETILLLMEETLRERCTDGERFAILDVRNGNFITSGERNAQLVPLLQSEAVAFMSIWSSLDAAPEPDEEFEALPIRRDVPEPREGNGTAELWPAVDEEPEVCDERLDEMAARSRREEV